MRFGGNIFKQWKTPEEWAQAAIDCGYSAVYFPVDHTAPVKVIDSFCAAAREHDLVICEIGVWNNVLDPNDAKREAAMQRAIHQLELADYVGANCCVNIAGSRNAEVWDGPHPENFSQRVFDEVVDSCQTIIDTAKPQRTCYTLEAMPWVVPDTPECYLALIRAIDRKAFAAHLDIVNVINSPALYYRSTQVINQWFDALGPYIRSIHAKDTILHDTLTVHLEECRPGLGTLDYRTYLRRADALGDDRLCMMLEHLNDERDYAAAAGYIKGLAAELNIHL